MTSSRAQKLAEQAQARRASAKQLRRKAEQARTKSTTINRSAWGVAAGVMVYSAVNVTMLLIDHDVPWPIAPLLSLMVDLGLCVALWSAPILAQYGRHSGWVHILRLVTALMSWGLNAARPALHWDNGEWTPDWVGVGLHSCGPVLLLVVAEAAAALQRILAEIVNELEEKAAQAELEAQSYGEMSAQLPAGGSAGYPAERSAVSPPPLNGGGVSGPLNGAQRSPAGMPPVDSPAWRAAVTRLRDALSQEIRSTDGSLAGRGLSHLVKAVALAAPELDDATVRAFVEDYLLTSAGQAPTSGLPWEGLLPVADEQQTRSSHTSHTPRTAAPRPSPSAQVSGDETTDETTGETTNPDARMRAFWDAEIAAGRVPTGARLAAVGGVSPATGKRRRAAWEAELPEQLRGGDTDDAAS